MKILCNRPELLSKGRHIFGPIVGDYATWSCHRLPQKLTERFHGVRQMTPVVGRLRPGSYIALPRSGRLPACKLFMMT